MDIKDVGSKGNETVSRSKTGSKSKLSSLTAGSVPTGQLDAADLNIVNNPNSVRTNELRQKVNQALNSANIAVQVSSEVDQLFTSISGVIEQANDPTTPSDRIGYLEKEGNDLLNEVKRVFSSRPKETVVADNSDEVRSEVEQKLSRALDALFPSDTNQPFGISKIDLSTKDTIIDTITQVQKAKKQIEELSKSVDQAAKDITLSANFTEVALQNSEAAQSSVRDLDSALQLAHSTKLAIDANPEGALASVGELGERAVNLLRSSS